ncbi:MAG: hypothetical protein J6C82_02815 [Clostridia bacterium]|nr:hypothetical protein [Clostridia bacterium]
MSVKEKMTALADEIRAKTGEDEPMALDEMASKIEDVYNIGVEKQNNMFWELFQCGGNRNAYTFAFSYWDAEMFYPKYDLKVVSGDSMFRFFGRRFDENGTIYIPDKTIDLTERLKSCGVKLDTSEWTSGALFTLQSGFHRIPEIDSRNIDTLLNIFSWNSLLEKIDKIILKNDGSQVFSGVFVHCLKLKDVIIEGKIGNDFDIHWSPLSKESILSIFNALLDISEEKSISLSLSAIDEAFETTDGAGDGSTSDEWKELLGTKSNWTVVLM